MDHHVVVRGGEGMGLVAKRRDKGHLVGSSKKGVDILLKLFLRLKDENITSLN